MSAPADSTATSTDANAVPGTTPDASPRPVLVGTHVALRLARTRA